MLSEATSLREWLARRPPMIRAALFIAVAGWLAVNLLTLDRYPPARCDEAFWSEIAYHGWREGRFGFDSHQQYGVGFEQNVVPAGRLFELSIGLTQAVFGAGLWGSRFSSFLAGLAGAVILYQLGRRMYSVRVGLLAAAIFGLSWRTVFHAHYARPEAWTAVAGVIVLWLLWRAVEQPTWVNGFLAGLGAALAVDTYLPAMHFAVGAGLFVVVYFGRVRAWRIIAAFAAGGGLGLAYWLAAHLLPDPSIFTIQMFGVYVDRGATALGFDDPLSPITSLLRFYWQEFIQRSNYRDAFPGVYFLAGVLYTIFDRSHPSRLLIAYYGLATLAFAILMPDKTWYTAMIWIPLLCLMTAVAIEGLPRHGGRYEGALRAGLAAALLIVSAAGSLYLLHKFRHADFEGYARPLLEEVPADAMLVAPLQFWFVRQDHPFKPTRTLADLEELVPAYVVASPYWICLYRPDPEYDEVYPVLTRQCQYIASTEMEGYPPAELFYCADLDP